MKTHTQYYLKAVCSSGLQSVDIGGKKNKTACMHASTLSLIIWISKKTWLILNPRNVLVTLSHTRIQHTPHLMWSQWGLCAVFGRCFLLIPICGHWRKQIIDTWELGSDASAELINVSLILAVLHCDGFVRVCVCVCVCVCVSARFGCLCTLACTACMRVNEYTWFSTANYFECSRWQCCMQHGAIHLATTVLDVLLLTVTFPSSLITVSQK